MAQIIRIKLARRRFIAAPVVVEVEQLEVTQMSRFPVRTWTKGTALCLPYASYHDVALDEEPDTCCICLCEYEAAEKISTLPCKHCMSQLSMIL